MGLFRWERKRGGWSRRWVPEGIGVVIFVRWVTNEVFTESDFLLRESERWRLWSGSTFAGPAGRRGSLFGWKERMESGRDPGPRLSRRWWRRTLGGLVIELGFRAVRVGDDMRES